MAEPDKVARSVYCQGREKVFTLVRLFMASMAPCLMLTVIDEYTRQALCVAVATKMGHAKVLDALYPLFLNHERPEYLRSDNGPEFIAGDFQAWLKRADIKPIQIYPGSPWENGYNERFNVVFDHRGKVIDLVENMYDRKG